MGNGTDKAVSSKDTNNNSFSYFFTPINSPTSKPSSNLIAGSRINSKQVVGIIKPCEYLPLIFAVLILDQIVESLELAKKLNHSFEEFTNVSIGTYIHKSPTLNSSFLITTCQPNTVANTILSAPSIDWMCNIFSIDANFVLFIINYIYKKINNQFF